MAASRPWLEKVCPVCSPGHIFPCRSKTPAGTHLWLAAGVIKDHSLLSVVGSRGVCTVLAGVIRHGQDPDGTFQERNLALIVALLTHSINSQSAHDWSKVKVLVNVTDMDSIALFDYLTMGIGS